MNIVITGSTKGIGLGLAREFLKRGHKVLINGRTDDKCREVETQLEQDFPGSSIISFACDVCDYGSVDKMFIFGEENFGSVDIWINNAGMDQNRQTPWNHDVEWMHRIIDVNIKGMVNGTRAASERMADKGGYIYNMEGFGSNDMMTSMMSFYGMTKRALTYFTKSAAKEAAGTEVKICRLSPGMVITDLIMSSLPDDPGERRRTLKMFHILADRVETVTPYLVEKILKNRKNGASISWLTNRKVMGRFLLQPLRKRRIPGLDSE